MHLAPLERYRRHSVFGLFVHDVHAFVIIYQKVVNTISYKLLAGIHQIYNFSAGANKDELIRF